MVLAHDAFVVLAAYRRKKPITADLKGETLAVGSQDEGFVLQMKRYGISYYVSCLITVPQRLALNPGTNSGDITLATERQ
jgi:hypothetical protein